MALKINPEPAAAVTAEVACASSLINAVRSTADVVARGREIGSVILWNTGRAEPSAILGAIAAEDQVKLMHGDIAARLLLALRTDNPIAAFAASSPVPATHVVTLKGANGSAVDLAPELAALLTKMGTVKSVEVATVAL